MLAKASIPPLQSFPSSLPSLPPSLPPLPPSLPHSQIKDITDQLVVAETLRKLASQDLLELHATEPLVLSVNIDRLSALAEGVGVAGKEEPGGPPGSKRHR